MLKMNNSCPVLRGVHRANRRTETENRATAAKLAIRNLRFYGVLRVESRAGRLYGTEGCRFESCKLHSS